VEPPMMRLISPILLPHTGRVSSGAFALPGLMGEGWDPDGGVTRVFAQMRMSLVREDNIRCNIGTGFQCHC
jgi:hypothetical protein